MVTDEQTDVLVIGTGNAAFCAALEARDAGANVLMVDKAPEDWLGGNSFFTAGAYRLTHSGVSDLSALTGSKPEDVDIEPYDAHDFLRDMRRVTDDRCDSTLTHLLIDEARPGAEWMQSKGIQWELMFSRQSHMVNGRARFWGNLVLGTTGGGKELIRNYVTAARKARIPILHDTPVVGFTRQGERISGVTVHRGGHPRNLRAKSVVVASGGFEADPRLRAAYLGPKWDNALVRGTPFNTGEVLLRAIDLGAQSYGHWSGCHSIAWDAAAPMHGDRELSNRYSRQAYPYGVVVNLKGHRFIDEGADFRNYTYAKYGAEVLKQPSSIAFQLFDAATIHFAQNTDYSTATASRYEAPTLEELARVTGIDAEGLSDTVGRYNASIEGGGFDPSVRDGQGTRGIDPPKTNWAQPLTSPPFVAFAVTCGITFTFGGLRIDPQARVLDLTSRPLPGLYAAGEVVGGLFYHNYPGGTGLASGTVFGRRAGRHAASFAMGTDVNEVARQPPA